MRTSLAGGAVTTLASPLAAGDASGDPSIAVDTIAIYWTNMADGTVMKLAKP